MPYKLLVSTEILNENLENPDWVVLDCRFSLDDVESGRQSYQKAHIPGAIYAHLNEDLSGPILPGRSGRHPLPKADAFAEKLSAWGIDAKVQVVVYDENNAAFTAYRLWWMARWLGHDAVAILDGGIQKWQNQGRPVRSGSESRAKRVFMPRLRPEMVASVEEVEKSYLDPAYRLLDGRGLVIFTAEAPPNYDPVNGHIPGAISAPAAENYTAEDQFLPALELKARFNRLLGGVPLQNVISYCGSGVRAAQNIFAMHYAGLEGEPRLYAGSWSEWITDPKHPIARGS